MQKNKWYASQRYHDERTDLQIQLDERDGYWTWEVFDYYGIYATGQTPEGHGRLMAKEMALDWIYKEQQ